jgi:UDP-N-acetylglucosamine:LPS N-acetylglucosamine transferase
MPADLPPPGATGAWCVIAGGGTGGHVLPGLAVARELVLRGHDPASIRFLGSERGPDVDLVTAAGFAVTALPGRGIQRRLTTENLGAAAALARGVWRGIGEVRRARPAVLLCLGGYASVAGTVGAVLARVPIVVTEQNARASLANRLAARVATASAVPVAGTDLPRAVVTGNPVRPEIVAARDVAAETARRALGIPGDRTLVVAMSGSLGARTVNRAVIGAVERLAHRGDLAVRHVIGRRDWGTEHAPPPALGPDAAVWYQAVEYEDRSDLLLAAADLFVGRAGGTVAELTTVGVPAILVPLPSAPADHQTANAAALVDAGAARLLPDARCDGAGLADLVTELVDEPGRLRAMAAAAAGLGHPDAAARVADLLEEHARRG